MAEAFRARTRGIESRERFIGEIGLVFESMHLPRIAGQIFGALLGQLQALAHEGLLLLGRDGDPRPLMEVRDMYAFLERELPLLIDRWESQRRAANREEARP